MSHDLMLALVKFFQCVLHSIHVGVNALPYGCPITNNCEWNVWKRSPCCIRWDFMSCTFYITGWSTLKQAECKQDRRNDSKCSLSTAKIISPQKISGSSSTSCGFHLSITCFGTPIGSSTNSSVLFPFTWSIVVTRFSLATISIAGWAPTTLYLP